MQKVVIDTNVIVSAIIQQSYPYLIINELFIEGKIELTEYYEVLARPKFEKFQNFFVRAEALLTDIETEAQKYFSTITIDVISDKDDNIFLELADECNANFLITGNMTDFTMTSYKQTKIVTPREYWEVYKPA